MIKYVYRLIKSKSTNYKSLLDFDLILKYFYFRNPKI